ncbi:MAG: hypothetical protein OXG25_03570 [Gammaproteobacteria bacterium]|nr:hypothetical protein [Gammaproteobacteria bacterium]
MTIANGSVSTLTAAMPESIGDLTFATKEWVDAARDILSDEVERYRDQLQDVGRHSFSQVAHNAPTHLHVGNTLAYTVIFENGGAEIVAEELPDDQCDMKMTGDHSLMSNMARLVFQGKDPKVLDAARNRLFSLGRWQMFGTQPPETVLHSIWQAVNDTMAERTMPRFVFMTPEWVSNARAILTTRAQSEKYRDGIKTVDFTFSEEFTHTPEYAFPDGSHGGFWVRCRQGKLTVGAGPLPEDSQPADMLTKAMYAPVVPVGRTVVANMTDAEKEAQDGYQRVAFRFDKELNVRPAEQTQPSGRGPMPPDLGRVFLPLHDELSKRTSGELPSDYDKSIPSKWGDPQIFDRHPDYDPGLLRYDEVDIYGNPLT